MNQLFNWSKEIYEKSISSRCWQFTPHLAGWDNCPDLQHDRALQEIVRLEQSIAPVPDWAKEIVERAINLPPFYPHASFPQPYLEIIDAIGKQKPPIFIHGCYAANRERKQRMLDYVFCLDAWLAGATPEQASAEIENRGIDKVEWQQVCQNIWQVLGTRTELKRLLIQRTLHRQRWWIKSLVWDDDRRDVFCQDRYLGDVHCGGDHYGNPDFRDPYTAEVQVPEVIEMETQLNEICPDWKWFREVIHNSWLCAPKAFRFFERLLWAIGKERKCVSLPDHPMENADRVPDFLQCTDTYPDPVGAKNWVSTFVRGLEMWLRGQSAESEVENDLHQRLGKRSATKIWLVELFLRKLRFLNLYGFVSVNKDS
ncbi:hypothetical protein JXJ21_13800 [candidate division KSB1 bacterium]|nr:hypothetical protein [candidate division KSB1 bacterium]